CSARPRRLPRDNTATLAVEIATTVTTGHVTSHEGAKVAKEENSKFSLAFLASWRFPSLGSQGFRQEFSTSVKFRHLRQQQKRVTRCDHGGVDDVSTDPFSVTSHTCKDRVRAAEDALSPADDAH